MPNLLQTARLARLEARAAQREHVAVVRYRDRAEVPALPADLPPGPFGCIVVPAPVALDAWSEAMSRWRIHP